MNKKFIETGLTIAVISGITGFFIYQNHQRGIAKSPSYEGNEVAIARPIKLEDTQYKICQTTKISDGDTIAVDCDGEKLKLRFCGIDAPEKSQPLGAESKALLSKLVEHKQVFIRPIEKDRYGRTVAEVEVGSNRKLENGEPEVLFVNSEMARSGMAYHYKQYSGNCPNRDRISKAEDFAKEKKVGVWSGDYQKPWDYRKNNK